MSVALSDTQKLDWLQLIRSDNVGPRTFRMLVNKFGGAGAALAALPDLLRGAGGQRAIRICARGDAEREYEATLAAGARFVALGEEDYPAALRAIDAPPPLIVVRGQAAALRRPAAAIVGSRNASAAGLAFAERLARGLGREGLVIVSGLARGIDAAAHRASLPTGTIGVLAGGLSRLYPADHAALADQIAETGALVTEMPLEWEPRGRDFPRRNRIVSGLSLATIVVEATRRSGSLITARFALEQGRELFAAPGSPLDPRAEGANDLLREGAHFCTRPEDVMAALRPMIEGGAPRRDLFGEEPPPPRREPLWDETDLFGAVETPSAVTDRAFDEPLGEFASAPLPSTVQTTPRDAAAVVAALLGPSPVAVDDLARAAGVSAAEARRALMELELAGRIERHGGDRVSSAPER